MDTIFRNLLRMHLICYAGGVVLIVPVTNSDSQAIIVYPHQEVALGYIISWVHLAIIGIVFLVMLLSL